MIHLHLLHFLHPPASSFPSHRFLSLPSLSKSYHLRFVDSSGDGFSKMANENGGDGDLREELKTYAVLGGRGFIGRSLVERLLRLCNWIVRVADSSKSPELKPSESNLADAFTSRRATYFQVDVRDKSQIVQAIEGVSVLFYTDSVDSYPQDFYFYYKIIVQGANMPCAFASFLELNPRF